MVQLMFECCCCTGEMKVRSNTAAKLNARKKRTFESKKSVIRLSKKVLKKALLTDDEEDDVVLEDEFADLDKKTLFVPIASAKIEENVCFGGLVKPLNASDERSLIELMGGVDIESAMPHHLKSLCELIDEKLAEKQDLMRKHLVSAQFACDDKVLAVYRKMGNLLARYRSGKLPKALKVLPTLKDWFHLLVLARPDEWSAAAMFQATRIFASNMNDRVVEKFYVDVLLPRIRDDIAEYKKLNYHLFMAIRKAMYKPGAFFRGIILPLAQSDNCTLRESVIVGSIIEKCSLPMLHVAVALFILVSTTDTSNEEVLLMFSRLLSLEGADDALIDKRKNPPALPTAGAVTIKDSKGRLVTKKVKVHRYIAGKRPKYANSSSDEEGEKIEDSQRPEMISAVDDRRLNRLSNREFSRASSPPPPQHRHHKQNVEKKDSLEDEEESRLLRRQLIREQILNEGCEELFGRDERLNELEQNEDDEDDEDDDDEELVEDLVPRLKPVFVKKSERFNHEIEIDEEAGKEDEVRRRRKERREQAKHLVEEAIKAEVNEIKQRTIDGIECGDDIVTDGEEDSEIEYEKWKLRELRRIKRDKEERERLEEERTQIERIRKLAERGRLKETEPRQIINQQPKGKYKYLQKYYHRGAFYLDKEDEVLKRDFALPTLDDHFDKSVLPKVMQVKKFGMASRTKYTHLVDQDTTTFDSAWTTEKTQITKWHTKKGGGMKQVFERPSLNRKPTDK